MHPIRSFTFHCIAGQHELIRTTKKHWLVLLEENRTQHDITKPAKRSITHPPRRLYTTRKKSLSYTVKTIPLSKKVPYTTHTPLRIPLTRPLPTNPKQGHNTIANPLHPLTHTHTIHNTVPRTPHRRRITRPSPQGIEINLLVQPALLTMQTRHTCSFQRGQIQHRRQRGWFRRRLK